MKGVKTERFPGQTRHFINIYSQTKSPLNIQQDQGHIKKKEIIKEINSQNNCWKSRTPSYQQPQFLSS